MPRSHGMSKDPAYRVWKGMRQRCNPNRSNADRDYAGRGIRVCDAWNDFPSFLRDMGPRPSPKHSIDRINNDGNYEPGNCRWATNTEQGRNKRTTRYVRFAGERICLADAAERAQLTYGAAKLRIKRVADADKAFAAPLVVSPAGDLIGQRFAMLTVIARAENTRAQKTRWHCACDCGGRSIVVGQHLKNGNTRSCGCIKLQVSISKIKEFNARRGAA